MRKWKPYNPNKDPRIIEMRKFAKNLTPEKALQFLIEAGICTSTGRLKKFYR